MFIHFGIKRVNFTLLLSLLVMMMLLLVIFSNVVMNEQNPMHRHPGDYALYRLGSFHPDDVTGVLVAEEKPTLIIDGSDL